MRLMPAVLTLPLALALAGVSSPASAAGLSLRWSSCAADGGVQNRAFACNTNLGSHELVLSFVPPVEVLNVFAYDVSADVALASATLPGWWQFYYAGSCRRTSSSFVRHAGLGCPALFGNVDAEALFRYASLAKPTGWGRMDGAMRVPSNEATDLAPFQELGLGKFTITNAGTVGTGSCAGCLTPACIVFNLVRTYSPGYDEFIINDFSAEHAPGSNYVTWQGGGGTNCPAATPSRSSTWGAVKSLYR